MKLKDVVLFCVIFILSFTLVGCGLFELVKPDGSVSTPGVSGSTVAGTAPISVNLNLLANFIIAYVVGKLGYNKAPALVTNLVANLLKLFSSKKK